VIGGEPERDQAARPAYVGLLSNGVGLRASCKGGGRQYESLGSDRSHASLWIQRPASAVTMSEIGVWYSGQTCGLVSPGEAQQVSMQMVVG